MDLEKLTPTKVVARIEKKIPNFKVPEKIENAEEYASATEKASIVGKAKKDIEGYRDFYAKPHYNTYKDIRKQFEPFVKLLEKTDKAYRAVMIDFKREEKKELDKKQEELEAKALENAKDGEEVRVPIINEEKTVDFGGGRSQTRTITKWEVTDISKVPTEYLEVNKSAMGTAVKEGKTPPGIRVYEDISIALSR